MQRGYVRVGAPAEQRYRHESWPALTLEYTPLEIGHGLATVDPQSLATVPGRIDGRRVRLVDLDGEGLPGLLTTSGKGLYYARPEGDGRFGPPRVLPRQPSPTGASSWQLVDLDGDGVPSFAQLTGPQAGAFKRVAVGTAEEWAPHRPFRSRPNFDLSQPNVLMLDVTGDGLADVVVFELGRIVFYPSLGHGGFAAPVVCGRPAGDDRSGPRLVFGDATRAVFLADMTGDGLSDLVRVENGRVLYWPNQGYGRFGRVVEMAGAPWFDRPDRFRADRIRFGDIDGSGTADLVYLGGDGTRVWINAAGNRYAAGVELPGFPTLDTMSSVELADILGTGGAALVWSTSRAADRGTHVRYAELTPRGKPYLLRTIDNGMGLRRTITYAPSTRFYLEDRAAGRPWVTRLPFVVHVVEHVEIVDAVTQRRFGSRYRYHHGYFDGAEREFRGFAVVEQIDTESFAEFRANTSFPSGHQIRDGALFVPPVLTRTRFHTGAWLDADAIAVRLAAEDYRGDAGDPASVPPVVLPASALPSDLSPGERREAMRALRGRALRQEVYAMALQPDGSATLASPHPFRVVEGNATVRRLQPRAGQRHASFFVHDRESLEQHYERDPSDPRLAHRFTLAVDDFGNVTRTAAVSYRRRGAVVPGAAQDVTAVVYAEASVANAVVSRAMYRLGVPVESRSFEVTGLADPPGGASVLSFAEVDAQTLAAPAVAFEAPPAEGLRKRLIASSQQRYYADDLRGALPLGQVGTRALPFEQRAMLATQAQIAATFAGLLPGPGDGTGVLDVEGGFVAADGAWWRRSGRQEFDAEAFYLPVRAIDAFGGVHSVDYDPHRMHVVAVTDPLGNVASSVIDYRVLQAAIVTDANGNRQQAVHDVLGLVVATVVVGKDGEGVGDTFAQPTVRMTYDLHAFAERGAPVSVRTFRREQYASVDPAARILESVAHYDGGGRVVQTKAQAEPGLAPHRDAQGLLVRDAAGRPELVETATRWVGSGRTIVDNKGNPVKQYEPFFSDRSDFDGEDELAATGVTPLLHYDAFGRLVRTDFPDGTVSRIEIEAWRTVAYDPNDTVLEGAWFAERMAPGADPRDRRAAELTAAHANTPSVAHADSLGRPVLTDVHDVADGVEVHAMTRQVLDIEGNVLQVVDARGNVAESRVFGMGGVVFVVDSVDAGWRRMLVDVAGAPLRGWNARGFASRARYDGLRRATHAFVTASGSVEMLVARTVFGESAPGAEALNLRGRAFRVYDGAGVVSHERFDFAGNLRRQSRRLARAFEATQDWAPLEEAVPATIEGIAAAAEPALEAETFAVESEYDALGRVIASTTPDQSVTLSAYNEAGLLESVAVRLRGAVTPTSFVSDLDYNARGQRQRCVHGNGNVTTYEYDARTFRLARLRLVREADSAVLQDLRYTYDPSGNVMQIRDGAQQDRFFANAVVSGDQRFEYSAVYRLVRATGREHASLGQPVDQDFAFGPQPHPEDPAALREYTQEYQWDAVGNLLRVQHGAAGGSYTRQYVYAAAGNRLLRNSAPGEAAEPFSHSYSYDAHGNMTAMPHLAAMAWDHADRLQHADLGGGGDVWFVYDAAGERVRKVQVNVAGSVVRERVYLGGVELYRERAANSATPTLVRESLHVGDDTGRLCLVETLTVRDGVEVASPVSVRRHQYGNHLGSASLELDAEGAVISYEEFHPFGTTSYAAATRGSRSARSGTGEKER